MTEVFSEQNTRIPEIESNDQRAAYSQESKRRVETMTMSLTLVQNSEVWKMLVRGESGARISLLMCVIAACHLSYCLYAWKYAWPSDVV